MAILTVAGIFVLYVIFSFGFAIFVCKNLIGEDMSEEEEQAMLNDIMDYIHQNQF